MIAIGFVLAFVFLMGFYVVLLNVLTRQLTKKLNEARMARLQFNLQEAESSLTRALYHAEQALRFGEELSRAMERYPELFMSRKRKVSREDESINWIKEGF